MRFQWGELEEGLFCGVVTIQTRSGHRPIQLLGLPRISC